MPEPSALQEWGNWAAVLARFGQIYEEVLHPEETSPKIITFCLPVAADYRLVQRVFVPCLWMKYDEVHVQFSFAVCL